MKPPTYQFSFNNNNFNVYVLLHVHVIRNGRQFVTYYIIDRQMVECLLTCLPENREYLSFCASVSNSSVSVPRYEIISVVVIKVTKETYGGASKVFGRDKSHL